MLLWPVCFAMMRSSTTAAAAKVARPACAAVVSAWARVGTEAVSRHVSRRCYGSGRAMTPQSGAERGPCTSAVPALLRAAAPRRPRRLSFVQLASVITDALWVWLLVRPIDEHTHEDEQHNEDHQLHGLAPLARSNCAAWLSQHRGGRTNRRIARPVPQSTLPQHPASRDIYVAPPAGPVCRAGMPCRAAGLTRPYVFPTSCLNRP
jgi:hypothetical protein